MSFQSEPCQPKDHITCWLVKWSHSILAMDEQPTQQTVGKMNYISSRVYAGNVPAFVVTIHTHTHARTHVYIICESSTRMKVLLLSSFHR